MEQRRATANHLQIFVRCIRAAGDITITLNLDHLPASYNSGLCFALPKVTMGALLPLLCSTHTHTHLQTHLHTHSHTHTHTPIPTLIPIYTYSHTHTYTHRRTLWLSKQFSLHSTWVRLLTVFFALCCLAVFCDLYTSVSFLNLHVAFFS